jgi:hypothetical protein
MIALGGLMYAIYKSYQTATKNKKEVKIID